MKFLCDRCKTRYSIGDDRVRGKILKIRCKNCANVITVREGMEPAPEQRDPRHPTTMIPTIQESKPASPLNAAFSAQLAKPPPALEEEWYVSIDGEQSGPFNLGEAQRWIASKPFDADLHCWSEGFDDWLPVDKVSHFRGLRTKPVAPPAKPAPPPMPRIAPRAASTASSVAPTPQRPEREPIDESEPKPLFAATMASLEKSASTTLPPVSSPAIKTNGAAPPIPSAQPQSSKQSGRTPAIPSLKSSGSVPAVGAKPASSPNGSAVPSPATGKGTGPNRSSTVQGVSAGAAALAAAFDSSEGDQLTAVGAPPFNEELEGGAEPFGGKRDPFAAKPEAPKPAALSLDSLAKEQQGGGGGEVEDDGLDIGEVSRVVNLADLQRSHAAKKAATGQTGAVGRVTGPVGRVTGPVGRVTGPVNRVTASVAKMSPAELGLPGDPNAIAGDPSAGESVVAAPVAHSHKRGMIMLLGVAGVLLLGVVGAVVLMVTSSSDDTPLGLGRTSQINSDRPEDIGHPRTPGDTQGPATTQPKKPTTSHWPQIRPQQTQPQETEPTDPNLKKLGADEIEDMAAKQGEGTKFCYIRAQKGALGLEMLDLKKINVTLTVDKTGAVTDVQLSEHAKDTFGACLIARIKGWKFRVSPGGTYRIALAFSNG